jgi:hypothetical protein
MKRGIHQILTIVFACLLMFGFTAQSSFAQQSPLFPGQPGQPTGQGGTNGTAGGGLEEIAKKIQKALETFITDYYGFDLKEKTRPVTPAAELKVLNGVNQTLFDVSNPETLKSLQQQVSQSLANPVFNAAPAAGSLTQQTIDNQLAYKTDCTEITKCRSAMQVVNYLYQYSGISNHYDPKAKQNPSNNQVLNMDSLLGPLRYQKKQTSQGTSSSAYGEQLGANTKPGDYAYNFINIVTGAATPIPTLTITEYHNLKSDAARVQFVTKLRRYLALMSVGLSNFNTMLMRRMPQQGLGEKAGLPNATDASPLEVENYMARRRLGKQWRDEMEKASPLTIQRQTLYTLAELNYQLYQLRQENERILATVSAMQVGNIQMFNSGGIKSRDKKAMQDLQPGLKGLIGG